MTFALTGTCPDCVDPLGVRRRRCDDQRFIGCTDFPQCRFAADYDEALDELAAVWAEVELCEAQIADLEADLKRRDRLSERLDRAIRDLVFECHPDRNPDGIDPTDITRRLLELRRGPLS